MIKEQQVGTKFSIFEILKIFFWFFLGALSYLTHIHDKFNIFFIVVTSYFVRDHNRLIIHILLCDQVETRNA